MGNTDYYTQLGVPRGATEDDIRKAYRALARRFHPDRNEQDPNAAQKFQLITEAYDVLSNPEQRRSYDRLGSLYQLQQRPPTPEDLGNFVTETFSNLFGKNRQHIRGADIEYSVYINLEDTLGTSKDLHICREINCTNCQGSGADGDAGKESCPSCKGSGKAGKRLFRSTCERCDGFGFIVVKRCPICAGLRRIDKTIDLKISLPKGIQAGQKLRIKGEGHQGIGEGGNGDLLVIVYINEHRYFERQMFDIYCKVPLLWNEAILGCNLDIPTLQEPTQIRIPPNTPSHEIFRLNARGIPHSKGVGDLYIQVIVEFPQGLTEEQKKNIQAIANSLLPEQTPNRRSMWN